MCSLLVTRFGSAALRSAPVGTQDLALERRRPLALMPVSGRVTDSLVPQPSRRNEADSADVCDYGAVVYEYDERARQESANHAISEDEAARSREQCRRKGAGLGVMTCSGKRSVSQSQHGTSGLPFQTVSPELAA